MNRDMQEKGIVARDCLPPEPRCRVAAVVPPAVAAGLRRETIPGNNLSSISLFELDFSESKASIKKHAMGPLMT